MLRQVIRLSVFVGALASIPNSVLPQNFAVRLDGNDDYINIPHSSSFNWNMQATIECWVKINQSHSGVIFNKWMSGYEDKQLIMNNERRITFHLHGPEYAQQSRYSRSALTVGQWTHIAGTCRGDSIFIYFNGQLDTAWAASGSPIGNSTNAGVIGNMYYRPGMNTAVDAQLDEFRIWNVYKSPEEIRDMMYAEASGSEQGLVAAWHFNEGQGQTAFDSSPNQNNGRLGSSTVVDSQDPQWVISTAPLGLVAHWNCDEGSGNLLHDNSGNGNDGTIYGANWLSGLQGSALNFDGINDYISCGTSLTGSVLSGVTVAAWVYIDQVQGGIVFYDGSDGEFEFGIIGTGQVFFSAHFSDGAWPDYTWREINSIAYVREGQWNHIAATYSYASSTMTLFIDGHKDNESIVPNYQLLNPPGNYFPTIGAYNNSGNYHSNFHKGIVDELRVYDRALDPIEIQYLYDQLNPYGNVTGTITETGGTTPISGALVRALQNGSEMTSFSTGTEGQYTLTNVPPGFYDIEVSKSGYATQTQPNIEVIAGQTTLMNLQLTQVAPHIVLSPTSMTFNAVQNGSLPASRVLTISNSGGGTADWYIDEQIPWLDLDVWQGSSNSTEITVSINTTDLLPSTYTGEMTVTSTNADNSPQTVEVEYVVTSLPHIVFDEVSEPLVGVPLSIGGYLANWDGSTYANPPSSIGVEDPVSRMTMIVGVAPNSTFSHTTSQPVMYAGAYLFNFGWASPLGQVWEQINIPVTRQLVSDEVLAETRYPIQTGPVSWPIELNTYNISMKPELSSLPTLPGGLDRVFYKEFAKNLAGDLMASWKKVINDKNGSLISIIREENIKRCSDDPIWAPNCAFGYAILGWQLYGASTWGAVLNKLEEGVNLAETIGLDPCVATGARSALDKGNLILFLLGQSTTDFAFKNPLDPLKGFTAVFGTPFSPDQVDILDADGCPDLDKMFAISLKFTSPVAGMTYVASFLPKLDKVVNIKGFSPIAITVTDPLGRHISPTINEIPGAVYMREDFSQNGDSGISIIIPLDIPGDLSVAVEPLPGANPADSFTVIANYSYYADPIVLADNVRITNIPIEPYELQTFENLPPQPFSLVSPQSGVFHAPFVMQLQWQETTDPNPGHEVHYDLMLATDAGFTDSVVIYDVQGTRYDLASSLLGNPPNAQYFWKARARDAWNAATFSTETFQFTATGPTCCTGRVGDANGVGTYPQEVTISDIQTLVTAKFIQGKCTGYVQCLAEGDVNQSGGANPACNDITISDIQTLVNHLFIAGPASAPLKDCL